MNENLLLVFIILNATNVVIQTIKSLVTIKCGKLAAATVNAIAYGLYSVVVIYMVCDLPLLWKAGIIAICNFIGVFIVKWAEEKLRKDKLWLVKMTVSSDNFNKAHQSLNDIPHTYFNLNKYIVFDCYCSTQKDTVKVLKICKENNGKVFATENRLY